MVNRKAKGSQSKVRKRQARSTDGAGTKPKFPYATKPNSIRKFLELVPQRPRPTKVNADTLKAWGMRDTNDQTIIRVLKAMDFVASDNTPTDKYVEFMSPEKGPGVLAAAVHEVWAPLFEHSHEPHREDDSTLRNYFNIHSGGSEKTMSLQIQTFKAVCDHADFRTASAVAELPASSDVQGSADPSKSAPGIHIDLHIHLPENKSRRDYEYMFEDIARYLFGRQPPEGRDNE